MSNSRPAQRLSCITRHLLTPQGCATAAPVAPALSAGQGKILEGIRVIDLSTVIAAPSCCAYLADMGANVVKIERVGHPDVSRSWGVNDDPERTASPEIHGMQQGGSAFTQFNRGKRSIAIDIHKDEGKAMLKRMLATADVFVTNVRLKSLRKLGLDYESIATEFPRLIYGHLSAWGRSGPKIDDPGFDIGAFWANSGMMDLARPSDDSPMPRQVGGVGDSITSIHLAGFIGMALYHRERTGQGQLVDAALMRSGLSAMANVLADVAGNNRYVGPEYVDAGGMGYCRESTVLGERRTTISYSPYRLKCGRWIQMMDLENARGNAKIFKALGLTEERLLGPPETRRPDGMYLRRAVSIIDKVLATKTLEEWKPIFAEHDVWYARVNRFEEMWDDEQAWAAGSYVKAPGVRHPLLGVPVLLSAHKAEPQSRAPGYGEHTSAILGEFGYTSEEEAQLRNKSIVE